MRKTIICFRGNFMKYEETFYIYIKNNNEKGNDFLVKVLGATFEENPRLFVYKNYITKNHYTYCLSDKETGQLLLVGLTYEDMKKKYFDKGENAYWLLTTKHFDLYQRKVKAFKQLLKENLIGEILGVAR